MLLLMPSLVYRLDASSNWPRMQQTSQTPSLHGPPSFGQIARSVPVTRCCSINPLYVPSWGPFIQYLLFCDKFTISPFPASPLTLRYFCSYIANHVSHKTIKVYLSGIWLEHLERGHHDPTDDDLLHLLCKGIKQSQGDTSRPRLPITINVLKALKTQLRNSSYYPLVEKRLLWSVFTVAFYAFLRAGEFTDSSLQWCDVQSSPTTITIHLRQSKTDPFRRGQSIILQATSTSTCPVRADSETVAGIRMLVVASKLEEHTKGSR